MPFVATILLMVYMILIKNKNNNMAITICLIWFDHFGVYHIFI